MKLKSDQSHLPALKADACPTGPGACDGPGAFILVDISAEVADETIIVLCC